MDIHHGMIVHAPQQRVYEALTAPDELAVWFGVPVTGSMAAGEMFEIHFDRGPMRLQSGALQPGRGVEWRLLKGMWPMDGITEPQSAVWGLEPYEVNTEISLRVGPWPQDDGVFASVSYKWATYMMRLKVYLGDTREIEGFMVRQEPAV